MGNSTYRENNDLQNPVGSLQEVRGTGGSVRHRGEFSFDNPWLDDMHNGADNQDIDAAYERAVNWEADRQTLLEQREYDEARLAEQREYDSPLARIQREREAGINSDLTGGSSAGAGAAGSGSSAQLQSTTMPQSQAQSAFSNKYDNTSLVFNGINSAANLITSLTGVAGTVMNGIAQFKMLPSQIGLSEAQSNLAIAQANEVNTLLAGKQNAQEITNNSAYLSQLAQIAQLTKADITDDALSPFLSSVGLTDEQLPGAMSVVRELHKNPEQLAKLYADSNNLRKNKLINELYTEEYLRNFMSAEQSVANNQILAEYYLSSITKTMNEFLFNDDSYSQNLALAQSKSVDYSAQSADLALSSIPYQRSQLDYDSQSLKLMKDKLRADISTFMWSLENRRGAIQILVDRRNAVRNSYKGRNPTYTELSVEDALTAEILALESLNSNQFAQMHQHFLKGCFSYSQRNMMDSSGQLRETDSFRQSLTNFSSATYFSLFPSGMTYEDRQLADRGYSVQQQELVLKGKQYELARDQYVQNWVNIAAQVLTGGLTAGAIYYRK